MINDRNHGDMPGSFMIVAGETSGDIHGAGFIKNLKERIPGCSIFGIGGGKMQFEGMEILFSVEKMAILGIVEVIRHLPFIHKVFRTLLSEIKVRRPAAVVLIDYPDFNIRLAKKIRKEIGTDIKIMYYISPQVWAWRKNRIKTIARLVDVMAVVFEFETDLYKSTGLNVNFVGHPLLDIVRPEYSKEAFYQKYGLDSGYPVICLLPGSRHQEIIRHLPAMLATIGKLNEDQKNIQVLIGKAPHIHDSVYTDIISSANNSPELCEDIYDCMFYSTLAVVSSGTATLETGVAGTPMVIVYKMAPLTYYIAKLLVSLPYIGLVNIVHKNKVVPELIQSDVRPEKIREEITRYLDDTAYYLDVKSTLEKTRSLLGEPGASKRAVDTLIAIFQ